MKGLLHTIVVGVMCACLVVAHTYISTLTRPDLQATAAVLSTLLIMLAWFVAGEWLNAHFRSDHDSL